MRTRDLAAREGFEALKQNRLRDSGLGADGGIDGGAIDRLGRGLPMDGVKIACTIGDAEYKDWNEQWEENGFEPITIGSRCYIRRATSAPKATSTLPLRLTPRLAFGTGTLTGPRG